jgi:hypothetical protein
VCVEEGVPIYQGKIDKSLFALAMGSGGNPQGQTRAA